MIFIISMVDVHIVKFYMMIFRNILSNSRVLYLVSKSDQVHYVPYGVLDKSKPKTDPNSYPKFILQNLDIYSKVIED